MYLFFSMTLTGQPNFPDNGPVFVDSVVPRVDIFINPDTLEWIYENVDSNIEFHADFIFNNGEIQDTIEDIGFRLRGNTSRNSAKKSFKVSFNTFVSGRKYYGLEKMNLNGEHNDPSIIRSKIAWDLLREFEIPAPRSNHVEVYINDNYYGLYLNVEHIDEEFVESRFGNKNGNLYKCLWPADLDYLGSNPDLYKFTIGERRAYALKTNTGEDDYTDIAHFISVLNNTPSNDFRCDIEEVFNIHDYLKVAAVDVFLGNWDGYIYNKNNFYLYHNTETDKFEYIPYDLDNTFGIDWLDRDWGNRDIYDWEKHGNEERPLYTRMMANTILKDQYSYYFDRLLQEITLMPEFIESITSRRDMIAPFVEDDPFYPMDYGYSINDFYNSYTEALGNHVDYGLFPYINTRNYSALDQLELDNMTPIIKYINHGPVYPDSSFWATAFVEDESISIVEIQYSFDGGASQEVEMFDDGTHNDGIAGDNIYGGIISSLEFDQLFLFKIRAIDSEQNLAYLPCSPFEFHLQPSDEDDLVINEFMALNSTTIADEYGEYDDWIEIYNNENESVWLGDKFLSDRHDQPTKFAFPDIWLEPGEFVLVWADNNPEQGPLHANFKLNGDGEFIGLYDSEETLFFVLDSLSYGPQSEDISYGRIPDGNDEWIFYVEATPGYSNGSNSIVEDSEINRVHYFPNPVSDGYLNFNQKSNAILYNTRGVIIKSVKEARLMDLQNVKPGIYIIEFSPLQRSRLIVL